jgi:hypothetical protein|tara:strand:- start:294 stop:1160 length:867 start_codon:yes stop_codon:yes gene_type:complete
MFSQIASALSQDNQQSNTKYKDILKLSVGNIYTVRLLPNVTDPSKTFFHYYSHAWESFATGQYMSTVSPQTFGERDPIAEARYSLGKHGSDEEKAKATKIVRRENWLANVYVVNDPSNPDNDGKVKLLRFGKQLYKIIMDAVNGDDAEDFGPRIFDLSKDGCNFKIKCERQGDFPTYVSSRFAPPSKIAGMTTESAEEVCGSINDLESVFTVKSYDDLNKVLDEHFYCRSTSDPAADSWNTPSAPSSDKAEPAPAAAPSKTKPTTESVDDVDPLDDDKVKELLDGLGD